MSALDEGLRRGREESASGGCWVVPGGGVDASHNRESGLAPKPLCPCALAFISDTVIFVVPSTISQNFKKSKKPKTA